MTSRHIIYLLVLVGLLIPLIFHIKIPPTRLHSAEILFSEIETIKDGDYVFLSFDFGPGLIAENLPQAELFFEHLLRKNAKIILVNSSLFLICLKVFMKMLTRIVIRFWKNL